MSTKRAVLLNNNLDLIRFLGQKHISSGMVLNVTPVQLTKFDTHFWQDEAPVFESWRSQYWSPLDHGVPAHRTIHSVWMVRNPFYAPFANCTRCHQNT